MTRSLLGLFRSRPELYKRIDLRIQQMMSAGLEAEVKNFTRPGLLT